MSLKKWNSEPVADADINGSFGIGFSLNLLNAIRMIKDSSAKNAMIFNASTSFQDCYAESYNGTNPTTYSSSPNYNDGRNSTVAASTARSSFINGNRVTTLNPTYFIPGITDTASGDTLHDPSTFTNAANAFDGDDTTYADLTNTSEEHYLGRTFSTKTLNFVRIRGYNYGQSSGTTRARVWIQFYNGADWTTITAVAVAASGETNSPEFHWYDYTWSGSQSCSGVRVWHDTDLASDPVHTSRVYTFEYGTAMSSTSYVEHNIPSGTFGATCDTAFCTVLLKNWEAGADVQFKLKNATEDSGWLATNALVTFTAFTSQPTVLQVKLIPKTSSPTALYPAIYGAGVIAA